MNAKNNQNLTVSEETENWIIDRAYDAVEAFGLSEKYVLPIANLNIANLCTDLNNSRNWKNVADGFHAYKLDFTQGAAYAFNWVRAEIAKHDIQEQYCGRF